MKKTIAAVQCYGFHYLTSQYMFFFESISHNMKYQLDRQLLIKNGTKISSNWFSQHLTQYPSIYYLVELSHKTFSMMNISSQVK